MAQVLSEKDISKETKESFEDEGVASNQGPKLEKQESKLDEISNKAKTLAVNAKDATEERLSLEGQLKQARISLERFINPKVFGKSISEDTIIPKWVLQKAKGIVFLTVIKGGFLFAGNIGTGCVIVRKPDGGWTGPSSIGLGSISFGFLIGASKIDYIMILPNDMAVKQFTSKGQLRIGGELQIAIGPIGRDASGSGGINDKGFSVIYSYSHAKGLYGGISFDTKIIFVRPKCNEKFYKKKVNCFDILNGNIDIPNNNDYDMIIHLLDSYCQNDSVIGLHENKKLSIDDDENDDNIPNKISNGFNQLKKNISNKFIGLKNKSKNNDDKEIDNIVQQDKPQNE